jgi:hypothetical protein
MGPAPAHGNRARRYVFSVRHTGVGLWGGRRELGHPCFCTPGAGSGDE